MVHTRLDTCTAFQYPDPQNCHLRSRFLPYSAALPPSSRVLMNMTESHLLWFEGQCAMLGHNHRCSSRGLSVSSAAPASIPVLLASGSYWPSFSDSESLFSNIKVKAKCKQSTVGSFSFCTPCMVALHPLPGNNEGASWFPDFCKTTPLASIPADSALATFAVPSAFPAWRVRFSYSAPGDLCCRLMKYIFRMLNMHINYPINGSDFLRAISLHCTRNIFEGSEEK